MGWFATCDQDRAAGRAFDMGIFCATQQLAGGGAGINQLSPHHRYGNIGYWVRQSRQGCGIARQAVALLRDFGFQQLGLFRLEIVMGIGNSASEDVAIAAGAAFECRARNRIFLHLITHDPQPASRADMASEGLPRLHAPIQPTCS